MLKRNEGEPLETWDRRMADAYERQQPAAKTVAEMSEPERKATLAALMKPAPHVPQMPPDLEGKRVQIMTLDERRRAARALGISHLV